MSKKNRNKNRHRSGETAAPEAPQKTETVSAGLPEDAKLQENMKQDFKHLGLIIVFILALLTSLYYYNLQSHVLAQMTDKLFQLFA
jgi:hypothetical protein